MKNLAFCTPNHPSWIATIVLSLALDFVSGQAAAARLCLTSTQLPLEKGDPRISILEEKVAARFEEGNFSVVRGEAIRDVLDAVDESSGDVFDSATGEPIPERIEAYQLELGRVLREKLACEGRIRIRVESVLARVQGKWAVWDGARISIYTASRIPVEPSPEMRGWVAALSLWVELVDVEGRDLAFRSGAIEPLIHLRAFRPIDRLPDDRWLQDEKALDSAIDRTLGPKALYLRDRGNPSWRFPESALVWPKP